MCLHIQYVRRHEYTQMWALKIHTHAKRRTRTHKPVQSCFLFGGVQAGQSMKWPVHPLQLVIVLREWIDCDMSGLPAYVEMVT